MANIVINTQKRNYYVLNERYVINHTHRMASAEVQKMQNLSSATYHELSNTIFACALSKINPSDEWLSNWMKAWQKQRAFPNQQSLAKTISAYCELGLIDKLEQRNFCINILRTYLSNINDIGSIGNNHNVISVLKCINILLNVHNMHITDIIEHNASTGLSTLIRVSSEKISKISKTNGYNTALFHQYSVFRNFCATSLQEVGIEIPDILSEKIKDSIVEHNANYVSKLEQEVQIRLLESLDHLGEFKLLTGEYVPSINAQVDLLLVVAEKKFVIQVDGPHHYFWDDEHKRLMLNGTTTLNTKLLELSGFAVFRIGFMEWNVDSDIVIEDIILFPSYNTA